MRVNNMLQNIHTYDCTCRRNSPIDYHNNTPNLETGNLQSMQNITEHFNHTPNMRQPSAFSDFFSAVTAIRPLTLQQHTHLLRQQMRYFDTINLGQDGRLFYLQFFHFSGRQFKDLQPRFLSDNIVRLKKFLH